MMFLSFILTALLITLEGHLFLRIITGAPRKDLLSWTLGYPLGALINTLIFIVLHIIGVPLIGLTVLGLHVLILIILFWFARKRSSSNLFEAVINKQLSTKQKVIAVFCILFLAVVAIATVVHVIGLPYYYWDTFTNWALRAKITHHESALLMEGIRQPQYPILIPTIQVVYMFIGGWSDTLSALSMFMISLSAFMSIFIIIKRSHGTLCSLITLTLITGIPLALIHLRQGYADIHLTAFIIIAALILDRAVLQRSSQLIMLSALFIVAATQTKLEGIYYGAVPLIICMILYAWRAVQWKQVLVKGVLPLIIIASPWYLFTILIGLDLSPHGIEVAFHPEALKAMFQQLFLLGTFGIHWWAIVIMFVILINKDRLKFIKQPSFLWGILALIFILGTYTFTADVRGLINGDNFSRVMLLPTTLLTIALVRKWYDEVFN